MHTQALALVWSASGKGSSILINYFCLIFHALKYLHALSNICMPVRAQVLALVGVELDPEHSFSVSNLVQWGIFDSMEVSGMTAWK